MIIPPADATAIHQNIPGAQPDGQGGFIVPCNTNASVALTYSGQLFTIDPRDLAVQALDPQGTNCASGIASGDISNNQNEWLVSVFFSWLFGDHMIHYCLLLLLLFISRSAIRS
jgi:hypothetical protein